MTISPLAGKPAPKEMLVDLARLEREYFDAPAGSRRPRAAGQPLAPADTAVRRFTGRSPKRIFSPLPRRSATTGAAQGTDGPLYMGKDTHALSGPAQRTALEVLAANGVETHHPASGRRDADAGHLARDPGLQPLTQRGISPTALSSPRRTIRRKTAGSNTTRPMAARPTPTSPNGSRTAPTNC